MRHGVRTSPRRRDRSASQAPSDIGADSSRSRVPRDIPDTAHDIVKPFARDDLSRISAGSAAAIDRGDPTLTRFYARTSSPSRAQNRRPARRSRRCCSRRRRAQDNHALAAWRLAGSRIRALRSSAHRWPSSLVAAGAVIVGKTNCDEFAWDRRLRIRHSVRPEPVGESRTPGGSSGGSAAASRRGWYARARLRHGGSIRQPPLSAASSACLPTAVFRGMALLAFASSLDQIGPLPSVADGHWRCGDRRRCPKDATCAASPAAD